MGLTLSNSTHARLLPNDAMHFKEFLKLKKELEGKINTAAEQKLEKEAKSALSMKQSGEQLKTSVKTAATELKPVED